MVTRLSERQLAIVPIREPGLLEFPIEMHLTGKEAREKSPYKIGDVVKFQEDAAIEEALIVQVCAQYLWCAWQWIPKYRVRVRRKNGEWSRKFKYIYPGWIQRGYD